MSMTIQQAIENRERCYKYLIGCGPHATTDNVEAVRLSIEALREKAEREDPQPLTLEELRQMDGEPVWVCDLGDKGYTHCCVISIEEPLKYQDIDHYNAAYIPGIEHDWYSFAAYGKAWIAYRHKPKEGTT